MRSSSSASSCCFSEALMASLCCSWLRLEGVSHSCVVTHRVPDHNAHSCCPSPSPNLSLSVSVTLTLPNPNLILVSFSWIVCVCDTGTVCSINFAAKVAPMTALSAVTPFSRAYPVVNNALASGTCCQEVCSLGLRISGGCQWFLSG